jgi:hypothetical protein
MTYYIHITSFGATAFGEGYSTGWPVLIACSTMSAARATPPAAAMACCSRWALLR